MFNVALMFYVFEFGLHTAAFIFYVLESELYIVDTELTRTKREPDSINGDPAVTDPATTIKLRARSSAALTAAEKERKHLAAWLLHRGSARAETFIRCVGKFTGKF